LVYVAEKSTGTGLARLPQLFSGAESHLLAGLGAVELRQTEDQAVGTAVGTAVRLQ